MLSGVYRWTKWLVAKFRFESWKINQTVNCRQNRVQIYFLFCSLSFQLIRKHVSAKDVCYLSDTKDTCQCSFVVKIRQQTRGKEKN